MLRAVWSERLRKSVGCDARAAAAAVTQAGQRAAAPRILPQQAGDIKHCCSLPRSKADASLLASSLPPWPSLLVNSKRGRMGVPLDSTAAAMHWLSSCPASGVEATDFCSTKPSCTAETAGEARVANEER